MKTLVMRISADGTFHGRAVPLLVLQLLHIKIFHFYFSIPAEVIFHFGGFTFPFLLILYFYLLFLFTILFSVLIKQREFLAEFPLASERQY